MNYNFIPLIVDSSREGEQIIHADLRLGYSIACEFCNFREDSGKEYFDIEKAYIIIASKIFGEIRIPFYGLEKTEKANQNDPYAYVMKTNLVITPNHGGGYVCSNNEYKRKKTGQNYNPKEHLIDVKIDRLSLANNLKLYGFGEELSQLIRHGEEFCKFYIV